MLAGAFASWYFAFHKPEVRNAEFLQTVFSLFLSYGLYCLFSGCPSFASCGITWESFKVNVPFLNLQESVLEFYFQRTFVILRKHEIPE